jgi:DNA-binding NtrC family response regulator
MSKSLLSGTERNFLTRVSRSIFANPFSEERIKADIDIVDVSPSIPYEERLKHIIEVVSGKVNKLIAEGKGDIRKFSGDDRILIENAFLFHIYHQFYSDFDNLILEQIAADDKPCIVNFANNALAQIASRGFPDSEASHYFSIFFQMRRAYHFINRSIIGKSSCIKEFRLNLWNNIFTRDIGLYARYLWNRMEDYSTLLLGETGAGKGVAAAAIGRSGYIPFETVKGYFKESFTRAFISLNLSQFPEQLIESELFGHRKGAFTGAVADYEGVFSVCSPYGAIFLDEIGEVSIPLQIKLLQVLQERVFTPVGSHQSKRFQGRVIAATNRPLQDLRSGKLFRDDFYYRLCSDIITVPPLRSRIDENPEELDYLLNHTLERIIGRPSPELTVKVKNIIHKQIPQNYAWPGNVRELEQCIRRVLIRHSYTVDTLNITDYDFSEQIIHGIKNYSIDARKLLSGYCRMLYNKYGTYEEVAKRTGLDRRTAKKYLEYHAPLNPLSRNGER